MKTLILVATAILLCSCQHPAPAPSKGPVDLGSGDAAVRAFLGVQSIRQEFAGGTGIPAYAVTFAKFVGGKFAGFGPLDTGTFSGRAGLFEIAWRSSDKEWSYVFVTPMSTRGGTDPFFEHISTGSRAQASTAVSTDFLAVMPRFRDWYVMGIACGGGRLDSPGDLAPLSDQLRVANYTLLLLIKECPKGEEHMQLLEQFGELKP